MQSKYFLPEDMTANAYVTDSDSELPTGQQFQFFMISVKDDAIQCIMLLQFLLSKKL